MNNYILLPVVGVGMLLIAALISNMIKFEGGANPKGVKSLMLTLNIDLVDMH